MNEELEMVENVCATKTTKAIIEDKIVILNQLTIDYLDDTISDEKKKLIRHDILKEAESLINLNNAVMQEEE